MFNRHDLLSAARTVQPEPDGSVELVIARTIDQLVALIVKRREVLPFKLFRGAKGPDLRQLEQAMRDYNQLSESGCGLAALVSLTLDARPFIYPLRPGTVRDSECDRVALVGAFRPGDGITPLFVSTMTWSVLRGERGVLHDVELWEWNEGESHAKLVRQLEQLYRDTELAQNKIWAYGGLPQDALMVMPATSRKQLAHDFSLQAQSIAAGFGIRLHLPQDVGDANNRIVSEEGIQVFITWARFERLDAVVRVKTFFDRTARQPNVTVRLTQFDQAEVLDELRRQLDDLVAAWERPRHRGIRNDDGWYYLQKRGGGGGRDEFDARAQPCGHNSWFTAGSKAPQARNGAFDFFGEYPEELEGCSHSQCHCYRAFFSGDI